MSTEERRLVLIELLDDAHQGVQRVASASLERIDALQSFDQLMTMIKSGEVPDKVQAVYGLGKIPGDRSLKLLAQLIRHPKIDVAAAAVRTLVDQMRDPRLVKPFCEALVSVPPLIQSLLLEGLGALRDRRAVPAILEALPQLDDDGLERALQALGRIGDPAAESVAIAYCRHNNPRVRGAAAMALGNIGTEAPAE